MALYEFECAKCHHQFTARQSFAEHDRHLNPKCPECGSKRTQQLVSAVHVQTSKKS